LKGAREGGFWGFLKGTAKGLTGIITKPISGVLDLASHTTEGIKNTVTYFDDKANEEKKRKPRAFYGKEKFFKKYFRFEADLLNNLKVFEDGRYAYDNFIRSFTINEGKQQDFILVITFEHIIYYNQSKNKIAFVLMPENIIRIDKEADGLVVKTNINAKVSFS
jgi:vacuolar protein sorting-associated protein 13A/C